MVHSLDSVIKQNTHINVGLKFFNTIHLISALFIVAWMTNGFFSYASPYIPGILRWTIFLGWFGFAVMKSRIFLMKLISHSWSLIIFLTYLIILSLFNNEDYLPTYISSFSYLVVVYSIFLYYSHEKYVKFLKFLVTYIFIECIYIAINTFIKLQENPILSRILTADSKTIEINLGVTRLAGVGNYAYFYSLASIVIALLYLFYFYPKKKTLILLFTVLFTVVLVKASFTLALIFTGIFSIIIVMKKYTKYTIVTIPILLFFIYVLYLEGFLSSLFINLSALSIFSEEVSIRFMEVANFLSGYTVKGTDLASRLELYTSSIEAFYHNIIFGTSISSNSLYVAGDHSAWLDLLARFGFISLLLFVFFYNAYKYSVSNLSRKYKTLLLICWMYFIAVGIVNTLFFASMFIIWLFFLPSATKLLENKNKLREDG